MPGRRRPRGRGVRLGDDRVGAHEEQEGLDRPVRLRDRARRRPRASSRPPPDASGVWSAWTELFPSFNESQLLLTVHRNGEITTISPTTRFSSRSSSPPPGRRSPATTTSISRARARCTRGSSPTRRQHRRARRRPEGLRRRRRRRPAVPPRPARRARLVPRGRHADDPRRAAATVQGASFVLSGTVYGPVRRPGRRHGRSSGARRRGRAALRLPPTRRRRHVHRDRPAARAAAPLPRGVRRPGVRPAARVALPHRSRQLRRLSTGCTMGCGNVDYSLSANCAFFVFRTLAPPRARP